MTPSTVALEIEGIRLHFPLLIEAVAALTAEQKGRYLRDYADDRLATREGDIHGGRKCMLMSVLDTPRYLEALDIVESMTPENRQRFEALEEYFEAWSLGNDRLTFVDREEDVLDDMFTSFRQRVLYYLIAGVEPA